ncbi:MAG: LamG domain-containing protein [Melioribacteraceae bacterium]|nr:LamG domain-containing protein [Melioribacteraceae bacterium]
MNFIKLLFGVLTIFALQTFAQVNLEKGLVAYYPFSGNTADSSGNGHEGINHGATLTVDRYGQPNSAYYFNGSDTCMIEIPDHPDFNFHDSLTFVLWYRYDNNNKNSRSTLFNKGGADTSAYWGFRRYDFGELIFYNYPDGQWRAWLGQRYQNLEDGNWHWIAIRFHSKASDAFVDGELSTGGSSAFEKFLASNDSSLTIGNVLGLSSRGWAGEIDEIRFYNRYLSNTEISRLYSDPTSVENDEKLATEFKLFQNYPNPFNPTTTVSSLQLT